MKTILLLTFCLILPALLCAQPKIQRKQKVPEKPDRLEIAPEAKPQLPDSLALPDTLPGMPEVYVTPERTRPRKERDLYRMPVVRPQGNDMFNMPIYVPDSSVHYYIKQAKPDWPEPKKK
ncbi:MAG: hypothetical protein WCY58_06285 [Mariniphaga sp.]|nr:hypothetical protein [Mariniphaga sp.]MDD4227171.1 hypothetical protein [Mariniphaga sp.]